MVSFVSLEDNYPAADLHKKCLCNRHQCRIDPNNQKICDADDLFLDRRKAELESNQPVLFVFDPCIAKHS